MMMTNNPEKELKETPLGIYIHVPFCIRKCPYCGFYSKPVGCIKDGTRSSMIRAYVDQVLKDIQNLSKTYSNRRIVDSIFFGGGTPTVVCDKWIIAILDEIKRNFRVSSDCEISIEGNPGTFQKENPVESLKNLRRHGFNRISIGEQAFTCHNLRSLGRIHSVEEGIEAFRLARSAGFDNINIDLMFGIPGQTPEDWKSTIDKALELKPEHISFYSLQLEEGTPYMERFEKGELQELPDDIDRAMYHYAVDAFKNSGYKHYEISNCAIPGYECRHNLKYWTFKEYLGIGPSASSFIDGKRFTFANDDSGFSEYYDNTILDNMSEFTFTGLRLTKGINYKKFKDQFGKDFRDVFDDRWKELDVFFERGDLVEERDSDGIPVLLKITEKGIDISNQIMSVFV